jgi:hypothetical protein
MINFLLKTNGITFLQKCVNAKHIVISKGSEQVIEANRRKTNYQKNENQKLNFNFFLL